MCPQKKDTVYSLPAWNPEKESLAAAEADGIPLALRRMLVLKASQPLGNSKEEGASALVPLCLCFPPSYQVYRVLGSASV